MWASDTKASLCIPVFLTEWFWNCATGTDVANVSLYAEGIFLRSMAYYAFFIEGIEVAWTDKSWCKMRKKQKPAKCLPKNSNKWAVPVQFHSLCWVQL